MARKAKPIKNAKERETIKQVNLIKNEIFGSRLETLLKSTLCFFHDDEKGEMKPFGSGVLIEYKNELYCITAAHILAEDYNDKYVILNDVNLVMGGRLASSPLPSSGNRDDDKIDVSILKLDDETSEKIAGMFTPIPFSEIEIGHQLQDKPSYFAFGYPLTRTKKKFKENYIESTAWAYQSEPLFDFDFEKFGFTQNNNIAIKFDNKITSATIPESHYSADPRGISGCGLWYLPYSGERFLIGIMIEKYSETGNKSLIATKIDVVIKMIELMNQND